MDVLDARLPGAHISALQAQVPHASQRQLPQVALLYPAAHQRHGDVALHAPPMRVTDENRGLTRTVTEPQSGLRVPGASVAARSPGHSSLVATLVAG